MQFHPIKAMEKLHGNKVEKLSNRKIGQLRKLAILDWVFRFRYSSKNILMALVDGDEKKKSRQAQDLINRMVRRGEIRKFPLVTGFTKVGFCLTSTGFILLQQAYPNRVFSRFFTETASLTASNFVHDLAIQSVILRQVLENPKIKFANEWEIRKTNPRRVLDAVIFKAGYRIGVEVELTAKSQKRTIKTLEANFSLVENSEVDQIAYILPTEGLKKHLLRALQNSEVDPEAFQLTVSETLGNLILGRNF